MKKKQEILEQINHLDNLNGINPIIEGDGKENLYTFFDKQKIYSNIQNAHIYFRNIFDVGKVDISVKNEMAKIRNNAGFNTLISNQLGIKKAYFIEFIKFAVRKNALYKGSNDDQIFQKVALTVEQNKSDPKNSSMALTYAEERFFQWYLFNAGSYGDSDIFSTCDAKIGSKTIEAYNRYKQKYYSDFGIRFQDHIGALYGMQNAKDNKPPLKTKPKGIGADKKENTTTIDEKASSVQEDSIINIGVNGTNGVQNFDDIDQATFNLLSKEARGIVCCNYLIKKRICLQ